jgi:hypothetical protein
MQLYRQELEGPNWWTLSLLGRIPGDLTCMLANAPLSIPLPNKRCFHSNWRDLLIPGSWVGTGLPLQYLHCSQSTLPLSRLSTQVCKKLKFLAASSSTFHGYPFHYWCHGHQIRDDFPLCDTILGSSSKWSSIWWQCASLAQEIGFVGSA